MIKKKLTSILSAIMISMAVLTTNVQVVNAQEVVKVSNTVTNLEDGNYTIKNKTSYGSDSSHGEEMARKIIGEESKIKVENGKINVTLTLNQQLYPMLQDIEVLLDGEKLDVEENAEERTLTFTVPSIDSKVVVSVGVKGMDHTQEFGVENDTTTLKKVEEGTDLEDGNYTVKNKTSYGSDSSHGEEMARKIIGEESKIKVENGKINVTLTLNQQLYPMLQDIEVLLDGEKLDVEENTEERTLTFTVPSIDSKVVVSVGVKGMDHTQEFGVENDTTTLKKIEAEGGDVDNSTGETKPEDTTPETSKPEESKPEDTNTGATTEGESVVTKVYTIENDVIYDNPIGYQMARKYLNNVSKVEETNGKYVVILTFTGAEYMNNHEVYVNGNKVNATITNNNDEVIVKFEVASLNEDIKVSTYVVPMGRNVEFGVALKNDTLTLIDTIVSAGTNGGNTTGDTTSGATSSGSNTTTTGTGTSTSMTTNEAPVVVKGKLYSIKNNVTHESETGVSMARKYLESTSYVEEVNGKYYVTLTFTGKEFMQNHVIYVNGKKVNATITNSGDAVKVRFEVSKLSDSIKVKTYVVPMSREVEFGVELLEDTLTFIKEYDVENETLPQTGSPISAGTAATLGTILLGVGFALIKRR
ncbi:Hypothetical protein CM240_0242 [Clostridium bornimense]|uniref:Uncharacterized protein n=1 Tax=Clostridium bornimense TaxID=1216932 RepID=W6RZI3_9CLOT|nr:NEAT domain-containing protein [Clostridium bornimense]CDM67412.1 Hypothetical protein CM240_0242 [Clostridium bornimense]